MNSLKKIEIITNSFDLKKIAKLLDKLQISGYTIIDDVKGKGARGIQEADGFTDLFTNSYLMTACNPEELDKIIKAIRPVLKSGGGVAFVSDIQWVIH